MVLSLSLVRRTLFFISIVIGSFFLPSVNSCASAATLPYQAQAFPANVSLQPGETRLFSLQFKNIGSQTWKAGRSATAVYVYGSSSIFGHSSWLANDVPGLIREAGVKPGAIATISFYIKAPAIPGTYTEKFLLSYGPNQWIKGSTTNVTFTVVQSSAVLPSAGTMETQTLSAPAPTVAEGVTSPNSGYKAELVDKGGIEWQLKAEEYATVLLKFKNVGNQIWKRDGANALSVYTWSPKYRTSLFQGPSWKDRGQAGFLLESSVMPGQIGTIRLILKAPSAAGRYQEAFQLTAEDKAWIDGGTFTIPINVTSSTASASVVSNSTPSTVAGTYSAVLLLTSNKTLTLPGSDRFTITQGFKNAGTSVWGSRGLRLVGVAPALGPLSNVHDTSWPTSVDAVRVGDATQPGQIGFISYTIKAPAKRGDYVASFQLMADGQVVEGGDISIPITVTSDGVIDPVPVSVPGPVVSAGNTPLPIGGDISALPNEPIIRVGLYKTTDDTLLVRGIQGGITVTQDAIKICHLDQGQVLKVSFSRSANVYSISGPGSCTGQSNKWYVVNADDGNAPLEITDYSRPVSWLPGANDNKFRAKLELRYSPTTKNVWVINELPFETYLKGIAETSNVSPLEFQKALLTAARTYGLYHIRRGTKHATEFFHVDAALDQVYRGFGQEDRSPNIVDGVNKTRGQIVTHEGELAVTPYFSRSDGRTRDWTEVWGGGAIPWLKSVPVPHDAGQTLWGHGVGMSARGALFMASKDNAAYDQILKHFYTGTELRIAYK